jgi:hypothetical protein
VAARRISSVKVATRDFSANGSTGTGFEEILAAGFFAGAAFFAAAAFVAGTAFRAAAGAFRAAERATPGLAAAFGAAPLFAGAGGAGFLGFFFAIFA